MGGSLSRLVFQPPMATYINDKNLVWLHTKNNQRIPAFHVFRHGNAEDIGMIVNYFKELSIIWDVNIFAYEYTGYGISTGQPSESNVYADIEAAYEYLTERFQVPVNKLVIYGRSLGTGASVHLASRHPVKGMVLQSPLLSIHRIGINLRFTLPGDMFCNIDKQLYNACQNRATPYWIENAGHNNIEIIGREDFILNIKKFLKKLSENNIDNLINQLENKKKRKLLWRMPVPESL